MPKVASMVLFVTVPTPASVTGLDGAAHCSHGRRRPRGALQRVGSYWLSLLDRFAGLPPAWRSRLRATLCMTVKSMASPLYVPRRIPSSHNMATPQLGNNTTDYGILLGVTAGRQPLRGDTVR